LCHGELAKDRPSPRHLTEFYLWMSVGGVLGGLFNALVAPTCLPYGIIEYPMAMVLACLVRPYMSQDVSERVPAIPRRIGEAMNALIDASLFVLGMVTYRVAATGQAATGSAEAPAADTKRRGVLTWIRGAWSSNLLEIALDLTVPIAFGALALWL